MMAEAGRRQEIRVFTRSELMRAVRLERDAIDRIEAAFAALARGGVVMPPVLSMAIEENHGEVDVKTAYVPGLDGFAIKVSPGFFDNPAIGLPSLNGLMILLDSRTGLVKSVMLDNGYLTDLRTAAAGAVAANRLAPQKLTQVGVIGAGVQARLQIEALRLVRDFEELLVWARDGGKAAAYAAEMEKRLGRPVRVQPSPEEVVRQAQIVVTTTPSRSPLIRADWLHPGLHITAMGSDAPEKNELAPEILAQADVYVCDRTSQCATLGELHHALEAGVASGEAAFPELGEVILGEKPGRVSDQQVTVCDLTGTGIQDTAIAMLAHERCLGSGFGSVITS